jgi:hypothetical protein
MQREELLKEEIDQILNSGRPLENGKPSSENIIAAAGAAV